METVTISKSDLCEAIDAIECRRDQWRQASADPENADCEIIQDCDEDECRFHADRLTALLLRLYHADQQ